MAWFATAGAYVQPLLAAQLLVQCGGGGGAPELNDLCAHDGAHTRDGQQDTAPPATRNNSADLPISYTRSLFGLKP